VQKLALLNQLLLSKLEEINYLCKLNKNNPLKMSVKDTKAEVNTITYDRDKIEEKVGSIYEAIVIMGKRAEQINAEIRTELHQKLDEFAVHNST
jgi:hypothetical protein